MNKKYIYDLRLKKYYIDDKKLTLEGENLNKSNKNLLLALERVQQMITSSKINIKKPIFNQNYKESEYLLDKLKVIDIIINKIINLSHSKINDSEDIILISTPSKILNFESKEEFITRVTNIYYKKMYIGYFTGITLKLSSLLIKFREETFNELLELANNNYKNKHILSNTTSYLNIKEISALINEINTMKENITKTEKNENSTNIT